jgi:TRAP-type C4-dicarboxylate transport system permease small subunit
MTSPSGFDMEAITKTFTWFVEKINGWTRWVCIVGCGGVFLLALLQILFRYVLKISAPWTEEAARYLMIWMALLASGLAFRNGEHFNIDFLTNRLTLRHRNILVHGTNFLSSIFILCIILWGIPFAKLGFFTISPGLQITMFLPYLAIPVGGVIMLLNLILFTSLLFKKSREKES